MKKITVLLFSLFMYSCSYVAETVDVVYDETRPSVLLKKYMYFKDLSSVLDQHRATLEVYKEELRDSTLTPEYRQQRKSEAIGVVSIYNGLAAQYNSDMSKINYAFCNVGQLPQSNLEPLPREFKPFILSLK